MPIFTFSDAKSQLKQRIGNRTDIADAQLGKFINQAQQVMATNVKGIETWDVLSAITPLTPGVFLYSINGLGSAPTTISFPNLWAFTAIRIIAPQLQKMERGEWDMFSRIPVIPAGPPIQWIRRFNLLGFFSYPIVATSIEAQYRRSATPDVLEVPDEWFEHLINLALTYAYPVIGRNNDRDSLFAKLPQNLQLAVLNPLTSSQWEASEDPGMSVYAEW